MPHQSKSQDQNTLAQRLLAGTAIGLALSLTGGGTAVAQQSNPVTLPAVTVEGQAPDGYKAETTQSDKYPAPLVDTPKSITVIPRALMDDRGALSLEEVFRTTPGISLGAGEGGVPPGDRTFIRGFDARTDMFVDGVRDFGGYSRDPFNLEQVEISKGPGSADTGRGSTGGSINLVTKTPHLDAAYGADLTLGTDMTKRLTIDLNQPLEGAGLDGAAFRLNLLGHDAEVAGRDAVESQRFGFAPSLALGLGTPTTATISYFRLHEDGIPDYGHPFDTDTGEPVSVDRDNFYGLTSRDYETTTTDIGTVELEHRFNDAVSLRNQTRYGRTVRENVVTKPEYTAGATTVDRAARSRDSEDTILSNQTELKTSFRTGDFRHDLLTGIELARETSRNRGKTITMAPAADLNNPNPDTPYDGESRPADTVADSTSDTLAAYVFDTIELSPQWEISGGLRWDYFTTDYTSAAGDQFDRTDRAISGRAGLVYKPAPNGSIYVAYGTSINPSSEGLTLNDGTEQLEPEESVTYELGTKWDLFDERMSLSAALFRTEKTNARTSTGRGAPTVLDGEQRVDGFEIGIAGDITPEWSVFGGYTFLDSEITSSVNAAEVGNEFNNIAPHSFSIWTTYQFTRDFKAGGGALYTASRYANTANTLELPSYWRFDAMAEYQITDGVGVRLNVLNIADETYYDATHNGQFAYVAPGRTALLTTSFRF